MAKVALNKSSLNKEKRSLKTFNRYLPALEMKRQQLMIERKKRNRPYRNPANILSMLSVW